MTNYNVKYYQEVYSKYIGSIDPKIVRLSKFWIYNIFLHQKFKLDDKKVLDFGCGPGHLTTSIAADCYDVSEYMLDKLEEGGRTVVRDLNLVPEDSYDYILASHSLEHSHQPYIELHSIRRILKNDGKLFLILPIEKIPGKFPAEQDIHQHFYAWNFQSIVNLLISSGFKIFFQDIIYGPTGLNYSDNMKIVRFIGRIKKHNPSLFIVASK